MCQKQYYCILLILINFINCQININNSLSSPSLSSSSSHVPIFLSKHNYNLTIKNVPSLSTTAKITMTTTTSTVKLINLKNSQNFTNILELVNNFEENLKNIRNNELGVTTIQEIFDGLDFKIIEENDDEILQLIKRNMLKKLENYIKIINNLYDYFLNNIFHKLTANVTNIDVNTFIKPCPFDDFTLKQNYNNKQIEILNYLKTTTNKNNENNKSNNISLLLNQQIENELLRIYNLNNLNIKQIYYLSKDDHSSDYNCQYYFNNINFRSLYTNLITRKHIFLLIDYGNSFTSEQLDLSKQFALNIINMLSEKDLITIILIADEITPMILNNETNINNTLIYQATMDAKYEIGNFLMSLNRSKDITNHILGFKYSFELLLKQDEHRNDNDDDTPIEFFYITRGLLSRFTDAMNVLLTISNGQRLLKKPIIINTCAVILDEKRVMYEKQFLSDIAQQNYTKYNLNVTDWLKTNNVIGEMFIITKRHQERIIKTNCEIYKKYFHNSNYFKYLKTDNNIEFNLPILDDDIKDSIISITQPIKTFGLIGINVYLNNFAEDIIYYKNTKTRYMFLINQNGLTIVHPGFFTPIKQINKQFPVKIELLEKDGLSSYDLIRLKKRLINENSGNTTIINDNEMITYKWENMLNKYIICIVTKSINNLDKQTITNSSNFYNQQQYINFIKSSELTYHRLDLIKSLKICYLNNLYRQLITYESSTIYLSPSTFQSPFNYIKNNINNDNQIKNFENTMAYLKDVTNLLANPGLKSQIRNDVQALYHCITYLKRQHQNSSMKNSIIRRYVSTMNGVMEIYPGCLLNIQYEPKTRPWYRKAIKYSGKIIITEPYLDAAGSGYIITIAHTIFEGKSNALHNINTDKPIGIIGIDLPYKYLYKLILDTTKFCNYDNIKCILIDNLGYIIAHPNYLDTYNIHNPLEHITNKETYFFNDILNHKYLIKKHICTIYQNRTIQRYYKLNITSYDIMTNYINNEQLKYYISLIKNTNIFAIIINSTKTYDAFCPCNTIDRICLNCKRMEQMDCECPCECPLNSPNNNDYLYCYDNDIIEYLNTIIDKRTYINYDINTNLNNNNNLCINHINCNLYQTHLDCLGINNCEWCQYDYDGIQLQNGFCTKQYGCFNGYLNSRQSYYYVNNNVNLNHINLNDINKIIIIDNQQRKSTKYSLFGPIGGALIALCLIVSFSIYCYRKNLDQINEQLYNDSNFDDNNYDLQLSRFNNIITNLDDYKNHDNNYYYNNNEKNYDCKLLKTKLNTNLNSISISDISPYHMKTIIPIVKNIPKFNQRNSIQLQNGESDHGYSTMTPHDDSDNNQCFTLIEPLLIDTNQRLSITDTISLNTNVSQQQQQHQQYDKLLIDNNKQQTNLITEQKISSHRILAPVTVHRHMEEATS